MLGKIPPPSEEDLQFRSKRSPMTGKERMKFVKDFSVGIVLSTITYATLTVFRDLRDNFAVELWTAMGYKGDASVLATSEVCIAALVLVIVASMIHVIDNRKAFFGNILLFVCGGILLSSTTYLFSIGVISPMVWMILSGFGLYLCYICFHTMFFERWIAVFKYTSNISFLIAISDSFGYLGSVGVLVSKNFLAHDIDWLSFVMDAAYVAGGIIAVASILMYVYFYRKVHGRSISFDPSSAKAMKMC